MLTCLSACVCCLKTVCVLPDKGCVFFRRLQTHNFCNEDHLRKRVICLDHRGCKFIKHIYSCFFRSGLPTLLDYEDYSVVEYLADKTFTW